MSDTRTHETLAETRIVHLLTIDMGNRCGHPTGPGGLRATSNSAHVTCPDCRQILIDASMWFDDRRACQYHSPGKCTGA
jgi:hypothetical protein